jgi:Raf kinase inhibitor-like YbhB/YbcL family protein
VAKALRTRCGRRTSLVRERETTHDVHGPEQQLQRRRLSRQDHILSAAFGFGCEGDNQSPHLAWSGAPPGTKSFAVTCFDPDAPTGSGFWHWLVVNIPPGVTELALDAGNPQAPKLPSGTLQTRTDFGAPGYGGPCPPPGDHPHRYLFTVFAVGVDKLQVGADTSAAVIGFQLHFNTLAKAAIMGLYKRGSA